MSTKIVFIFCAQALFVQIAFSQCGNFGGNFGSIAAVPSANILSCGSLGSNNLGYGYGLGINNGWAGADLIDANIQSIATSGGALPIQSASAIAPSGLSVVSENAYEGSLNVVGELPFLSAVAFEGALPSGGSGIVQHSCGNGRTAITNEAIDSAYAVGIGSAGIGAGIIGNSIGVSPIYSGVAGLGFGNGGRGCGCGLY